VNGAHALIQTLVDSGVEVCFANPGTSEMHFVAALDDVPGLRVVLGLFEGVATGAADGYARMNGRPACTLLHLGAGMANGMANLHNARRAKTPMVNIVGDHATYHGQYDSPLTSDIETVARTFSGFTTRPTTPEQIGKAVADAVTAARTAPTSISTLILPADVSWGDGAEVGASLPVPSRTQVAADAVQGIAATLRHGRKCLLLLGETATREPHVRAAAAIAAATGALVLFETSLGRVERGGGLPVIGKLNYRPDAAIRQLDGIEHIFLVDAKSPVAFFAYPDQPSDLVPDGCQVHTLSGPTDDALGALEALRDLLGAPALPDEQVRRPELPTGALTPRSIADTVAALLPEGAIVIDEGVTAGSFVAEATERAPRHDWLKVVGGAIGIGLPLAVGAAVAAPDRKIVGLQADGSTMYTIQGLWTHARESLDTTTIVLNNRKYNILRAELSRVGAVEGPKAQDLLDLSRPDLDFVSLAAGMGVEGEAVSTAEEFARALTRALDDEGPRLVEVLL
jgi:acetolactate synthase-1/2/3 large subunit